MSDAVLPAAGPCLQVACGRGIELIYEFLVQDYNYHRPDSKPIVKRVCWGACLGASGARPPSSVHP